MKKGLESEESPPRYQKAGCGPARVWVSASFQINQCRVLSYTSDIGRPRPGGFCPGGGGLTSLLGYRPRRDLQRPEPTGYRRDVLQLVTDHSTWRTVRSQGSARHIYTVIHHSHGSTTQRNRRHNKLPCIVRFKIAKIPRIL